MIDVEFNPQPGPGKAWWISLGLLAPVAGAVWVAVLWLGLERAGLQRDLAAARTATESKRLAARLTNTSPPPPYAATARQVWRQGRFEAAVALSAIESVVVDGVSVQAIDVAADQGVVKVELMVSDHERLNQYLDYLNAGLPTPQWRLAQVAMAAGQQSAALRAMLIYQH